jgi:hypothetical protein
MKLPFFPFLVFIGGIHCSPTLVMTTWKGNMDSVPIYKNILVVGVIHDTDLRLRTHMERHLVDDLKAQGYLAQSALDVFGVKGLANMDQEDTYRKLYNNGFDGLITIALLDKQKEASYAPEIIKYYSSLYFYNRIWNYKYIQADLTDMENSSVVNSKFRWESIFFDLKKLTPLFVVQSKPVDPLSVEIESHNYGLMIVSEMIKHKLLKRRKQLTVKTF